MTSYNLKLGYFFIFRTLIGTPHSSFTIFRWNFLLRLKRWNSSNIFNIKYFKQVKQATLSPNARNIQNSPKFCCKRCCLRCSFCTYSKYLTKWFFRYFSTKEKSFIVAGLSSVLVFRVLDSCFLVSSDGFCLKNRNTLKTISGPKKSFFL